MSRIFQAFVLLALLTAGIVASSESEATTSTPLLPNLIPLLARDVRISWEGGEKLLKFTTTSWNGGSGPLELRPGTVDTGSNPPRQKLSQRVYNDDGTFIDQELSAWMEYHPEHGHFHLNDYALYTLQAASAPGQSLRTGSKTTFCIIDTDRVNLKLPGAPRHSVYSTCGLERQGMSVGWGDSYGYWLAGQSLPITALPDGDYVLRIEVDPKNLLSEVNKVDNVSTVSLRINGDSVRVDSGGRGKTNR